MIKHVFFQILFFTVYELHWRDGKQKIASLPTGTDKIPVFTGVFFSELYVLLVCKHYRKCLGVVAGAIFKCFRYPHNYLTNAVRKTSQSLWV